MSAEVVPADLAAVQADDALLDLLGGPTPDDVDGELAQVLAAWRGDVRTDSDRPALDTERACAAIRAGLRARRRHPIRGLIAAALRRLR